MDRRQFVAGALSSTLLGGCLQGESWMSDQRFSSKSTTTPPPPKVTAASMKNAERVETLGRRILVQNTFPGIDPLFHTIGVKDAMIFHRGTAELFISDGLVNRCKTEEQLAAVLCSELGKMKAEKQSAARVGVNPVPFPEVGSEPARAGSDTPQPSAPPTEPDANRFARELLAGAGFDPVELDRVESLLHEAERNDALKKQMAGSAAAPVWHK